MHRTEGDGYISDPVGGQNVYADEDPPTRDATQVRYQEMNAFQEEICNVITAEGISLNDGNETVQQMTQLNTAIDQKISNLAASDIKNDSVLTGVTVKDAFEFISSDDITNNSGISGTDVTAALNYLNTEVNNIDSTDVSNISTVSGSKVTNALDTLNSSTEENAKISTFYGRTIPIVSDISFQVATADPLRFIQFDDGFVYIKIPSSGKLFTLEFSSLSKKVINTARTGFEPFVAGDGNGGCESGIAFGYGKWFHAFACYAEGKTLDVVFTQAWATATGAQDTYATAYSVSSNQVGYVFLGSYQIVYDSGAAFRIRPFDQLWQETRWRESVFTPLQTIDTADPGENIDLDYQWDGGSRDEYGQISPLTANGGYRKTEEIDLICIWDFRMNGPTDTSASLFYYYAYNGLWRNPHRVSFVKDSGDNRHLTHTLLSLNDIKSDNNVIRMTIDVAANGIDFFSQGVGYKDLRIGRFGSAQYS